MLSRRPNPLDRVIFLDIDGVLNDHTYTLEHHYRREYFESLPQRMLWMRMCDKKVANLIWIAKVLPYVNIVISSSWRRNTLEATKEDLAEFFPSFLLHRIVGQTGWDRDWRRADEIQDFLDNRSVGKFAVLDDEDCSQFGKSYFRTDHYEDGLTFVKAKAVAEWLSYPGAIYPEL